MSDLREPFAVAVAIPINHLHARQEKISMLFLSGARRLWLHGGVWGFRRAQNCFNLSRTARSRIDG